MVDSKRRLVVVGGVAGGASAAARARRLDEHASIVVFERGPDASFANCGLPYYLGGEIADRGKLLVAGPDKLKGWLDLDVRTRSEVVSIDRQAKEVEVRDLAQNRIYREPYDVLVLAPGAAPIRPAPLLAKVGTDHPRVLSLRNLPDVDRIKGVVDAGIKSATVIGGGFIGLEVAEQLVHRKVSTTLVEAMPHVLPPLDAETATPLHQTLAAHGVKLHLGDGVAELTPAGEGVHVRLNSGVKFDTDLVVLAIGVRPESGLAEAAGLPRNPRGAIVVNDWMQTEDPSIYAVGDAVEIVDPVLGGKTQIPLAGPANRQGRLAVDHAFGTNPPKYRGSQGTVIVRVFDQAAGSTGLTEKALRAAGKTLHVDFEVVVVHANDHAGYYPGAERMTLKLTFEKPSGRVLGLQVVGGAGVDKRLDVAAIAIQMKATVFDLEQSELAYSPQFGSAKDPINLVAFQAANILRGSTSVVTAAELKAEEGSVAIVDVRTKEEFDASHVDGAVNIPLDQLRARVGEVPPDRPIVVYCALGQRGYLAERILRQRGVANVRNLTGGYLSWKQAFPTPAKEAATMQQTQTTHASNGAAAKPAFGATQTLDLRGMQCPGPLLAVAGRIPQMQTGDRLEILASDPGFCADMSAWALIKGHEVQETGTRDGIYRVVLGVGGQPKQALSANVGAPASEEHTIVVFSNALDRVMASFILANGAAALGHKVTMFFTFWGLNVLRKADPPPVKKGFLEAMFGFMMPKGPSKLPLSQMNFGGAGGIMMRHIMKSKNVATLQELMDSAKKNGVTFLACTMSMDVMGIKKEELVDGLEYGGVGAYWGSATRAHSNLFI